MSILFNIMFEIKIIILSSLSKFYSFVISRVKKIKVKVWEFLGIIIMRLSDQVLNNNYESKPTIQNNVNNKPHKFPKKTITFQTLAKKY